MVSTLNETVGAVYNTYRYPAGFDGGNTDSCFSTVDRQGREVTVVIPSAIAQGSSEKLELMRSAVYGTNVINDIYKKDVQVTYNGVNYYVGYLALRQAKRSSTQKGDESRYYSQEQVVRLLATSGLAISDPHYEIDLVTTVPVGYFGKKLRSEIKTALEGVHVFTLDDVERQATIRIKRIMVEGPPALVIYGEPSAGQRRLIIDGGGHTTDFTLLDGNDPIADLCRGIDLGVENIGDYVAEVIYEQHNRRLTLQERTDILRAYGSRQSTTPEQYPTLSCGSYILPVEDIMGIVMAGCQKVANETLAEARSLWGVVNNVVAGHVVYQYHIGGSVLFYYDILCAKMPNLSKVKDPSQANARGSARIAKAIQ